MYEFENIKNNVSIIDVAEHYGLEVHRGGMCCCPFHNEKTPSMKLYTREQGKDEGFHCFGCGKTGDAISLTAGLLGISQIESARKIDNDFRLGVFEKGNKNITNFVDNQKLHREEKKKEERWIASAYKIAVEYSRVLDLWKKWYAPKSMNEPLNPLFHEAIAQKEHTNYIINFLINCSEQEQHNFYMENKDSIVKMAQRLKEIFSKNLQKNLIVQNITEEKVQSVNITNNKKGIKHNAR